jgi:enoyl-CoA hydratase/carnithine racemase
VNEGIALVTLNRPDRLNAWTKELENRYFDTLDTLDDDPETRVIVVTGAGRGFCPGMDMEALSRSSKGPGGRYEMPRPMSHPLTVRKPMIAAINGPCAGIGLVQALLCDLRFAAEGVKLATAFTPRGLPAEFGAAWLLERLVGLGRAADLLLSGRPVFAEEAREMGLVNRVVPKERLLDEALAYARNLASSCAPVAMAAVKEQLAADWHRTHRESLDEAVALVAEPERRIDFKEGVAAYVEKRAPAFRPLPPKGQAL